MSTARPRPQTAIISNAAKYVAHKREREAADAKARAAGLRKWERAKVDADVAHAEELIREYAPEFYEVGK